MKDCYVYIAANKGKMLYTGVTNDLRRRSLEHKQRLLPGFTRQYAIDTIAYFEHFTDIRHAIGREKQIKGYRRGKKIALIESINKEWRDLATVTV
ncbi:MAG TPA: GIY-YIG nuclease family protein [Candidatus Edwardsbacteria bacterium]|nr:GIY-YIG nuclease family protein [Candidatus Edwardsbacteria bacterium]